MSHPDLSGKVALVTGASRALGAETARAFASQGVKVVVNGRDGAAIKRVVDSILVTGGQAIGFAADCTRGDELALMRRQIETSYGRLDLIAAFAGAGSRMQSIEAMSEEQWDQTLAVNLTSKFLTVKTFLPLLKTQGGAIVLMSSSAGRVPG